MNHQNASNKHITAVFALLLVLLPLTPIFAGCKMAKAKRVPLTQAGTAPRVILGDERLDIYLPMLKGKRVALFSNQSGIVGDKIIKADGSVQYGGFEDCDIPFGFDADGSPVRYGEHILDALIAHDVTVTAIFCPEHGFRGTEDAGAGIANGRDEKTGVPILSLYGSNAAQALGEENLSAFDTLVVDIQDVGLRYYTYYITLYQLMEACAAGAKAVVILDRPNPNGFYVDGGILQDEYSSGVGHFPLPTVHGMTLGELARMMNGEGWLSQGKNACRLTVVPCRNYTHQTRYALVKAPSPNIKTMRAVYLYASTCFFENSIVSVARGTQFPFEAFGSPAFQGLAGYDFAFTPQSIPGATKPPFLGETCYGADLRKKALSHILREGIDLSYIIDAYNASQQLGETQGSFFGIADSKGRYWIDLLSGSSALRTQIQGGSSAAKIKKGWKNDISSFKAKRKPYLLYAEQEHSPWQVDASFPDWISNANFSADNSLAFTFYHGQGTATVTLSDECQSFSFYINGHKIDTKQLKAGGRYECDIAAYTRDGINTLQVSDIQPPDAANAVRIQIPYPVVKEGKLKESGISKDSLAVIDRIICSDIENGFTSAQLAIVKDGRLVYRNAWGNIQTYQEGGSRIVSPVVSDETLYDLASVTKMLSVNYAVQNLVTEGRLSLETKIVDILGTEFATETIALSYPRRAAIPLERQRELKSQITVRDLLCHTAGMHPGPNYYSDRFDVEAGSLNSDRGNKLYTGFDGTAETREETLRQLCRTPLMYEPGTELVYSDLDYMLLCFVVEQVTGERLDVFLRDTFWQPMGLSHITYNPLENGFMKEDCAATDIAGNTNAGKVDFTGVRTGVIQGEVHDAKAYCCMGGISGHAGLFASATDVACLASVMLSGGWGGSSFFSQNVCDVFTAPQNMPFADYGLGWWRSGEKQTPRHFGTLSSSRAFGHQGFTGTLVFIEPEEHLVIAYLTNKINTPMLKGQELMNLYDGNFYQSAVAGFVPQLVLMGLHGKTSKAQLKGLVRGMAEDALRKAQAEAPDSKNDPRWKAYRALDAAWQGL